MQDISQGRLLALDTSSPRGSVALLLPDGRVAASVTHATPNAHAEQLAGLLDEALGAAGWRREDLDGVAVGLGPGSFTGLRVGLALAQGIGLGRRIPVVGVRSLTALSHTPRLFDAAAVEDAWVAAIVDARRDECFLQVTGPANAGAAPFAVSRADAINAVVRATGGEPVTLVGEFARELVAARDGLPATVRLHPAIGPTPPPPQPGDAPPSVADLVTLPHAAAVGALARLAAHRLPVDEPTYLRAPDVIKPDLPPSPLAKRP